MILIFINLILYAMQFMLKDNAKNVVNKINNILSVLTIFTLLAFFVIAYTGLDKFYKSNSTSFKLSDTDYAISLALQISILKILFLIVGISICYYIMNRKEISKRCSNFRIGAIACLVLCAIFGVVFGYATVLGNDKEFSGEYYYKREITTTLDASTDTYYYSISLSYASRVGNYTNYRYEIRDGSETHTEALLDSYFTDIKIKNIDDYSIKIYNQDVEVLEFKPNTFNTQAIVFITLSILSLGGTITLYLLSNKSNSNEDNSSNETAKQTENE